MGPELAQPYTCHIAPLMADSHDPARHAAFRAVPRLRLRAEGQPYADAARAELVALIGGGGRAAVWAGAALGELFGASAHSAEIAAQLDHGEWRRRACQWCTAPTAMAQAQ